MHFIGSPYNFGAGGSPPPSFSPPDGTSLQSWLKGDAISGLSDSDPIPTWEDSHTSNHDGSQSSSSLRPLYKTNIVNGLPAVKFDGSSQYFDLWDMSSYSAGHIFMVLKLDAFPPAVDTQTGLWLMGGSGQNTHFPYTDSHPYEEFGSTIRRDLGALATNLSTTFRILSIHSASNDWEAKINGTTIGTAYTSNTVLFPVLATLGKSRTTYYFKGYIAEMFFYSAKQSSGVESSAISYLQAKYSI
jgi:hypothetical protein